MLDLNKENWKKIDKSVEELENEYIRIIRPVNDEYIPIDCPKCNMLLTGAEDIQAYKRHQMCNECELINWNTLNHNSNK